MMPVIRISDEVFGRLQKHATPFVDTPASVIERLLDAYDVRQDDCARLNNSIDCGFDAINFIRPDLSRVDGRLDTPEMGRCNQVHSVSANLQGRRQQGPLIRKNGSRYTVEGYGGLCEFLRGLGAAGWSPSDVHRLLATCPGGDTVSKSTVQCQVGAGKQARAGVPTEKRHHAGEPMIITPQQLSALEALIAEE